MGSVRSGLGFIILAIYIILFCVLGLVVGGAMLGAGAATHSAGSAGTGVLVVLIAGYAMIVAEVLMIVGKLMCLAAPAESGAQGLIFGSVACDAAGIVMSFLGTELKQWSNVPSLVGAILFVMFLGRLATYVGRNDLAGKSSSLLMMIGAVFACMVATPFMPLLALVLLILMLVTFVQYCGLLQSVKGALDAAGA